MGFTPAQQGKFRPLVEAAWLGHAAREGLDPKCGKLRRAWYESELLHSVGVNSTIPLDHGRDFDCAMAHFEALADDGSTYWQARAENGDLRRILHNVFSPGDPCQIDGHQVTAAYCSAIAMQSFRLSSPPALRTLKKTQLNAITRALSIHRRRHVEKS